VRALHRQRQDGGRGFRPTLPAKPTEGEGVMCYNKSNKTAKTCKGFWTREKQYCMGEIRFSHQGTMVDFRVIRRNDNDTRWLRVCEDLTIPADSLEAFHEVVEELIASMPPDCRPERVIKTAPKQETAKKEKVEKVLPQQKQATIF